MRIEDSFEVAAPIEHVWAAIVDPVVIGACLPGCRSIETLGPTSYRAVVGVELGPIKALFNLQVELREQRPPSFVATVTRGEEGTRASTLQAKSTLRLEAIDGGTRVAYASDVALVGRLGKFGLGVMRKKAESLGRSFAETFRARITQAGAA